MTDIDWKHLQVTDLTDPKNPLNGQPYVLYNPELGFNGVWIFLGVKWCLDRGGWENDKHWANDGLWNFLTPLF